MKKVMIAAAAAVCVLGMGSAFAAQTNTGCQGNCPTDGGTTTNNVQGGAGYGGNGGSAVGVGMGGNGGAGGSGVGVGLGGSGGSVVGSGNSSAVGGAGGAVVGSGNSSATGGGVKDSGNSKNQNANRNSNRNNNQSSATNEGNNATQGQTVNVAGDTTNYQAPRIPVSTAYAPNIMPTAVCMGSSSVGGQGMSFGFSLGSSWTDSNCMLLEQVRTVSVVLGQKEIAAEMMMAVPAYAEAVKRLEAKRGGKVAEVEVPAPLVFTKTNYELLGN